jgi:hypothetical protein
MMPKQIASIGIVLLLLLVVPADLAAQQEGVVKWLRYGTNITIQQNSGITIEEIQEVALAQGVTTFKRVIPSNKVEEITNVTVLEINPDRGQINYQPADHQAHHTFQVLSTGEERTIQLFFPPNDSPTTKFIIRYFVIGGIGFYEEGDRFQWQPFGRRSAAPIDIASTEIVLPGQFSEDQIGRRSSGLDNVNDYFIEGNKVAFVANGILAGSEFEVTVVFPHGVVEGTPPEWQSLADWTPTLRWGSLLLAVVALFFSLAVVFGWWFFRVRIAPDVSEKVPKYLQSPPGEVSPAVAGALLDGKVNPRHIMATLVDMAGRGVLNVADSNKDPESFLPEDEEDTEPVFTLYTVDESKATRPYEQSLYGKIFGYTGAKTRQLSGVRETLFMSVPELRNQIEFDIAKADYFSDNISDVRRQYLAFGGAGLLISLILAVLAAALLSRYTYLGGCIFIAFGFGAVAFMVLGFFLPKKTQLGANESVHWEAFRRYLKDMDVKHAAKIRPRFTRLLPYALAFGLEKQFVEKFAAAQASIPQWWGKPKEKLPDIGHNQAHAWVSSSFVERARAPQPGPEKPKGKGVIRRLGQPAGVAPGESGGLLKDIERKFVAFLKVGNEIFAKAPPLEETATVDFEALEKK